MLSRRADGGLIEDAAVRERERSRAAENAQPGPVEPPAGDRQDGDDQAEQQRVRKRVREVHRGGQRRAAGALDDRAEQDRGADGGDGECRERCVEPEAPLEVQRPRAHEQADPGVEDGVGDEPEPVGHRRRSDRRVEEEERVVEVAGGPQQQRRSEAAPGGPLLPPLVGRGQADERGAGEQDVVEPSDDLRRTRRLRHEQHQIDREEGGEAEEEPPAAGSRQASVYGWGQRLQLGASRGSKSLAEGISSRAAGIRPPVRVIAVVAARRVRRTVRAHHPLQETAIHVSG